MTITYASFPAEDGTRLSCLIALPDGEGPFPVLLTRTPYDKRQFARTAQGWASAGFAFVAQDVRGRYESEGEWLPYSREETDGLCTLQWIRTQLWCDGRVALEGSSYGAFAAFAAAQGDTEGWIASLITLVPAMGLRETAFHPSGAFHLMDRLWWEASFGSSSTGEADRFWRLFESHRDALLHLPVADIPDVFPMPLPHWRRACDSSSEQETIRLSAIRAPVLHIGGWHDAFIDSTLNNYIRLSASADPRTQGLIVGPWTHNVNVPPRYEVRDYGPHARLPLGKLEKGWLMHTITGEPLAFPPVLLFMMGANCWISPPEWPMPDTTMTTYYLTGSGMRLSRSQPGAAEPLGYRYDPMHPMPSREYPSCRQDLEARSDVLCYTSEPLDTDMLLTGAPQVRLWVGSTASSTDFYACLSEVDGAGNSIYITSGLARLHSCSAAAQPIRAQSIEIEMKPVCQLLPRSCQIRITIGSSCFPEYARSLNLAGDCLRQQEFAAAEQRVWHDADHLSYLTLPCHSDALERWPYHASQSAV